VLNKAPIDAWGVGTHMVTGGTESSFTGVYKLAAHQSKDGAWHPVMKISDNPAKITNPGIKQVWRLYNDDGTFKADVIGLHEETITTDTENRYYHPFNDYQSFVFKAAKVEALLKPKIQNGRIIAEHESLAALHKRMEQQLGHLHATSQRLLNPHIYKISLTQELSKLKQSLLHDLSSQ